MTSKNLCFKLMKEDAKRRIWLIALLFLGLFFAIVIPIVYVGSAPDTYMQEGAWLKQVTNTVREILGYGNPFVVILLSCVSVISGVSGFSYLHVAKKVDLYHSIPVKREQLFLVHFLNGILIAAVIYALNLLIGLAAASAYGVGFGVTAKLAFDGFCFHMAYYSLLYTTAVLAMVLTGNIIIALLGTGVFFAYGPMVSVLMMGYRQVYFHTYSGLSQYGGDASFKSLIRHSSPLFNYMETLSNYSKINLVTTILLVASVALVLALLAGWLYRVRPSESAGKAMAFTWVKLPLKILIVVPVALGFSMFFWAMRTTLGWAIFGLLWGLLFTHCLMEIIYHFDFRKLFAHRRHLVLCLVLSMTIFGVFHYDWLGFESYLPKADAVKTAAISMRNRDDWVTYGNVGYEANQERRNYYWNYSDSAEYASEHMELTDVEAILSIAQKGIELNRLSGEEFDYDRDYHTVTVQYTLKNGLRTARKYQVYSDSVKEEMERIEDSMEYKMGIFPLLNQTAEETAQIRFQQFNQMVKVEAGDKAELLAAYQEDFKNLTAETRRVENPIATIQFMTTDMDEAVRYEQEQQKDDRSSYSISNIDERAYYPIYPSFARTIDNLNKAGVQVKDGLPADLINQIWVTGYEESERGDGRYAKSLDMSERTIYMDADQIEALVPALIPCDYWNMNWRMSGAVLAEMEATVSIYSGADAAVQEIACYLNKAKLPNFVK